MLHKIEAPVTFWSESFFFFLGGGVLVKFQGNFLYQYFSITKEKMGNRKHSTRRKLEVHIIVSASV